MIRWRALVLVAVVGLLAGCGSGSPFGGGADRPHQQARDALARYDQAVREAGGLPTFVPVGELTGQIGNWEPENGDNKLSLMDGRVVAVGPLPALTQSTGEVRWDSGTVHTLPLISADQALAQIVAAGGSSCPTCTPLQVTGARLATARIQTTRGPATAPAWEYTLRGTAVRVTRVAVARSATVTVTPPPWNSYDPPVGIAIESATTTSSGRQLTVHFTGAPDPGSKPCGADYTAEALESDNAVAVIVTEHPHAADDVCNDVGADRTATVDLARPLGDRAVLESKQGLPVPVTIDA